MSKEVVFRDTAAKLSEHFSDYLIIVRKPDGLEWRMSDRTFALGASQRLQLRLSTEDQMSVRPPREIDDERR